jgi:hypothetical protein
MTDALPFASLPPRIQAASARKPRRAGAKLCPPPAGKFLQNNYRAEAAPNWGRNRKGAGAPRGNRNALFTRTQRQLLWLRAYRQKQRERLQRLARRVAQLESRLRGEAESEEQLYC